jgi:hypothetical protein
MVRAFLINSIVGNIENFGQNISKLRNKNFKILKYKFRIKNFEILKNKFQNKIS